MSREARPFTLTLNDDEAAEITGKEINGPGGLQNLMRRLAKELETGNRDLIFNDAELGTLIRYMRIYGAGGEGGAPSALATTNGVAPCPSRTI